MILALSATSSLVRCPCYGRYRRDSFNTQPSAFMMFVLFYPLSNVCTVLPGRPEKPSISVVPSLLLLSSSPASFCVSCYCLRQVLQQAQLRRCISSEYLLPTTRWSLQALLRAFGVLTMLSLDLAAATRLEPDTHLLSLLPPLLQRRQSFESSPTWVLGLSVNDRPLPHQRLLQ